MSEHNKAPKANLTTVAEFPKNYFLENLAVRSDNSILITAMNHGELWYVPAADGDEQVAPMLLHKFDMLTMGIAEAEPDVFLMLACNFYTTHESVLYKIDLRRWRPGAPIEPELFCTFPAKARGLNGCCLLRPGVLLVADSFAGLIWRVDFNLDGGEPSVRVWKSHDSMGYFPGMMKPEQPGVNGVRYAIETNYAYYTATAKKLFMRLAVNPYTLEAEGEPELVVAGRMGDDFCIDESASVIYLATHRQNTIDVVSMEPGLNSGFTQCVAGDPFTEKLIGPSGGAWGRIPGQLGRTAFFLTDGGTASPPPTGPQMAKLLRVELQPINGAFPGSG